jgi:hypothetical protein
MTQTRNECDRQISRNLIQLYSIRLKESSKQLRNIEREHLERMQKLYGNDLDLIQIQVEPTEA